MNRRDALTRASRTLTDNNIDDASLEAEILLRHTLKIDRSNLYSDLDSPISSEQDEELDRLLQRRISGEPSAYITGHREFFGLDFFVDRRVLIPRPETELLVEKAIALSKTEDIRTIADIGTGSGAIAISLAVNLPEAVLFATDISPDALEIARENASKHSVGKRIHFLEGNLVEALPRGIDMIVANLPYVKTADISKEPSLGFEPAVSLDGGKEGLDIIYRLYDIISEKLRSGGYLLVEMGQYQSDQIISKIRNSIPDAQFEIIKDLAGIDRVVVLRLTQA